MGDEWRSLAARGDQLLCSLLLQHILVFSAVREREREKDQICLHRLTISVLKNSLCIKPNRRDVGTFNLKSLVTP